MNSMDHITTKRNKEKYGFLSNVGYFVKCFWEWNKFFCIAQFLFFIPELGVTLFSNMMPAKLVQQLTEQDSLMNILFMLLLMTLMIMICAVLRSYSYSLVEVNYRYFSVHFSKKFTAKMKDLDYERLESKAFRETYNNAWSSAMYGKGFSYGLEFVPGVIASGVGIILYGTIIASQSILLLILVSLSLGINLFLLSVARKMHGKYFKEIARYSKGEEYITERCMDMAAGKDIRMYRMLDFILKKYDAHLNQIAYYYTKIHNWYLLRNLSGVVFEFVRDSFAYIYLIIQLVNNRISAAEFVFYLGIVATFSLYLENMIRNFMSANVLIISVSYFRQFMDESSSWRAETVLGEEVMAKIKEAPISIELRDVSFCYPNQEQATIEQISLTVKEGEKLALLGLNGAGKTTLVKLICGFYTPTKGEIRINGIPKEQFTKDEYMSLVSVLFQDETLLPRTVDENITSEKNPNKPWLEAVIDLAGFRDKYESLPQKGETPLIKKVEEHATDFSGGEKQKLLFARALYKKAPLIILDEPTAALDPIAENELYLNFGEAMKNRSAIYISHRLSSTRFCDRIVLLERGKVVEEGTHDTLMKKKGRYAELYDMQSKYYKADEVRKRRSKEFGDDYVALQGEGVFNE